MARLYATLYCCHCLRYCSLELELTYRRRHRMRELNSKVARVGQFEQFVYFSALHGQAMTKEIAAIKNCEIAGWKKR